MIEMTTAMVSRRAYGIVAINLVRYCNQHRTVNTAFCWRFLYILTLFARLKALCLRVSSNRDTEQESVTLFWLPKTSVVENSVKFAAFVSPRLKFRRWLSAKVVEIKGSQVPRSSCYCYSLLSVEVANISYHNWHPYLRNTEEIFWILF